MGGVMKAKTLIELLTDPEPEEKPAPKTLWEMDEDELAAACKTATVRLAHESAPVTLETDIEGVRQYGFDFLREEFRVKGST
jgi:hypothetical protein